MTKSGKGVPLTATFDEYRCEAVTWETEWKQRNKTDLRCTRFYKIRINNKNLCHKHAQIEALAIAVKTGKATVLPLRAIRLPPYSLVQTIKEK